MWLVAKDSGSLIWERTKQFGQRGLLNIFILICVINTRCLFLVEKKPKIHEVSKIKVLFFHAFTSETQKDSFSAPFSAPKL